MKKIFEIIFTIIITSMVSYGQAQEEYSLALEKKILKPANWRDSLLTYRFIGDKDGLWFFISIDKKGNSLIHNYNRGNQIFKMDPSFKIESRAKFVSAILKDSLLAFVGIRNAPLEFKNLDVTEIPIDNFEYQDVWINLKGVELQLDQLPDHIIDRSYNLRFSSDGKFLTCNPYSSRSAGYDPSVENFFLVFDLRDLRNLKKSTIACERCLESVIIGDNVFFEKEVSIGGGFDGYFSNIYMSPRDDINDTTLISRQTKLIYVDPKLNFVLGEKNLFGKQTLILIDLKTKRFQYLLGREYSSHTFFPSDDGLLYFDFGNDLISITRPKQFPFDALSNSIKRTTIDQNRNFWAKYSIVD